VPEILPTSLPAGGWGELRCTAWVVFRGDTGFAILGRRLAAPPPTHCPLPRVQTVFLGGERVCSLRVWHPVCAGGCG
jgi:hypothetical protein